MKAVTISQPYASLIASGKKWVENRTWPTNYRGEIAIHAGKGLQYLDKEELLLYPHGCVIAVGKLVACCERDRIIDMDSDPMRRKTRALGSQKYWSELARHEHTEGPWCWILEDIRPIVPVPIRGAQGLWVWKPESPIVFAETVDLGPI